MANQFISGEELISDQPEPTLARLRYSLGGDRPSQTTHAIFTHTDNRSVSCDPGNT